MAFSHFEKEDGFYSKGLSPEANDFYEEDSSGSDSGGEFEGGDFEPEGGQGEEDSPNKKNWQEEKAKRYKLDLYIDTEYCSKGPISLQAYFGITFNGKEYYSSFIIIDKEYQDVYKNKNLPRWQHLTGTKTFFRDLKDESRGPVVIDVLIEHLMTNEEINFANLKRIDFDIHTWFYFSIKDINIAFGNKFMRNLYTSKKTIIQQYRNLTGNFSVVNNNYEQTFVSQIHLQDISGLDKFGLETMAKTYGIPFKKDIVLESYKSKMDEAIKLYPIKFLNYGLKDAIVLRKIMKKAVKGFNEILKEVIPDIPESNLFTLNTIPMTIGSLVNVVFTKYIHGHVFKEDLVIKAAMLKASILNKLNTKYLESQEIYDIVKSIPSLTAMKVEVESNPLLKEPLTKMFKTRKTFKFLPYQGASCHCLTSKSVNNSLFTSTIVSGGRVISERALEIYFEKAVDFDICQAYGVELCKIIYPIGRPRIYAKTPHANTLITLGNFLKKYAHDLLFNNFKITVSGKLSFNQDLIYSRVISEQNIERKVGNLDPLDPDSYTSQAPHVMLTNEILHGVITRPVLEIIEKVPSNLERSELLDLIVESAIFWLDSDRVDTIEELSEIYLSEQNYQEFSIKTGNNVDNTSFKWFGVELRDLVGSLIQKRTSLKKTGLNRALEQSIKLFINTMYGVLASRFFPVNNVVVGDLITSSIRVKAWLMSKAFNLHITVTDGGICSLKEVFKIKKNRKKPGLDTLSSNYKLKDSKVIETVKLGGVDWDLLFSQPKIDKDLWKNIKDLGLKHLKEFWKIYSIDIDFDIEVKNIIYKGSYLSKAHYFLYVFNEKTFEIDSKPFFRIRGFHFDPEIEHLHPVYQLLKDIADNASTDYKNNTFLNSPWNPPNNGNYTVKKILRLPSWKQTLNKKNISTLGEDVMPGDVLFEDHVFRLTNTHLPIKDVKEYKSKQSRISSSRILKDGTRQRMSLFERYLKKYSFISMLKYMEQNVICKV